MSIALYPGSFDPITLGHLNIIRRSSRIFDEVVVLVMKNGSKNNPMFSMEERAEMVNRCISRYPNVRVEIGEGLLAEFANRFPGAVILKGLRAASDFEYEFQMNEANKHINPKLETMFLTSDAKYNFLSSSIVREIASYGGDLKGFVPNEIIEDIHNRAKIWRKT